MKTQLIVIATVLIGIGAIVVWTLFGLVLKLTGLCALGYVGYKLFTRFNK